MSTLQPQAISRSASAGSNFHSAVWLLWLLAGIAAISYNPLLNALVMVQAVLVAVACHTDSPVGHAFGLFLRLGLLLVVIRTVLGGIPVGGISYGGTLLFTLPQLKLPVWLGGLHLGGQVTLEMVLGGLMGGLRLWTLILVFGAFNAVADHYGLLRRTPRMLFHAGLAATIALTFVPQVILQLQAIRDAQRLRGHQFRSWRDGLPLIVPLLAGGLERSIQLAEAMDSRGYGRTGRHRPSHWLEALLIGGLTILALGLYMSLTADRRGWLAVIGGGLLAAGALHWLGAGTPRSRYIRERWQRRDTIVALASLLLLCGMTALRYFRAGGLLYTTLPRVTLPVFEPTVGALLLLLSVPALLQLRGRKETHGRHNVQYSAVGDRT